MGSLQNEGSESLVDGEKKSKAKHIFLFVLTGYDLRFENYMTASANIVWSWLL